MALRLLEIVLPEEDEKAAQDLLKGFDIIHFWHRTGKKQVSDQFEVPLFQPSKGASGRPFLVESFPFRLHPDVVLGPGVRLGAI